jgi:hypothetical protein
MTESGFYQKLLKPLFKKKGLYYKRFESFTIPDLYLSRDNNVLWAELKCVNRIKKRPFDPGWRPGQLAFIKENKIFGNSDNIVLILYYCGDIFWLTPQKIYKPEELVCQKNPWLDYLIR